MKTARRLAVGVPARDDCAVALGAQGCMPEIGPLNALQDFDLGSLRIRPSRRLIEGPARAVAVEPLVMQLLAELCRCAGEVLTRRDIFARCWGTAPVGDDSLNRVVAALRKALDEAGDGCVIVETVPRAGYSLTFKLSGAPEANCIGGESIVSRAVAGGRSSIRYGDPAPDMLRLEQLRHAIALSPEDADAWGVLALLCRHAAEYADASRNIAFLQECEASAVRALAIDAAQSDALVALATVAPLFGRWLDAREKLVAIRAVDPQSWPAAHELAILEMATGRVAAAKAIVSDLVRHDPLAAALHYKSIYQHWSTGDLAEMDHIADRAIQLWPTHPAVWTARLWTLAYTDRPHAALDMLAESAPRPDLPPPARQFLESVIGAVAEPSRSDADAAAELSVQAARRGPAQAVAALFALGLLERRELQWRVCQSYYLRAGEGPVPIRHMDGEPSINDQHRRITQILFTPACAALRSEPRFISLCDRIGLSAYWEKAKIDPDFAAGAPPDV